MADLPPEQSWTAPKGYTTPSSAGFNLGGLGGGTTPAQTDGGVAGMAADFAKATQQVRDLRAELEQLKKSLQDVTAAPTRRGIRSIFGGGGSDDFSKISQQAKAARRDQIDHDAGLDAARQVAVPDMAWGANNGGGGFADAPPGVRGGRGRGNDPRRPRGYGFFNDPTAVYMAGSQVMGTAASWFTSSAAAGEALRYTTNAMGRATGRSAMHIEQQTLRGTFRNGGAYSMGLEDLAMGMRGGLDNLGAGGGMHTQGMRLAQSMSRANGGNFTEAVASATSVMDPAVLNQLAARGIIRSNRDMNNPDAVMKKVLEWAGGGKFGKEQINSSANSMFRYNLRGLVGQQNEQAILAEGRSLLGMGPLSDRSTASLMASRNQNAMTSAHANQGVLFAAEKTTGLLSDIKSILLEQFGALPTALGAVMSVSLVQTLATLGIYNMGGKILSGGKASPAVGPSHNPTQGPASSGPGRMGWAGGAVNLLKGLGLGFAGNYAGEKLRGDGTNWLREAAGGAIRDYFNPIGGFKERWAEDRARGESSLYVGDTIGNWVKEKLGIGEGIGDPSPLHGRTDKGESHVHGLKPNFSRALQQMFEDNPRLRLNSGYRDPAHQKRLFEDKVREYTSKGYSLAAAQKKARKWVAPPPGYKLADGSIGKGSNHNRGIAADIGPKSEYGWIRANAAKYGLHVPMSYEPWHVEPVNKGEAGASEVMAAGSSTGITGVQTMGAGGNESATLGGGGLVAGLLGRNENSVLAGILSGLGFGGGGGGGGALLGAGSDQGKLNLSGVTGSTTHADIAKVAAEAGFRGQTLVDAVAVALAESSGNPRAKNDKNRDGSIDYGLWQINSVHTGSGFDPKRAFDPQYNAMWAKKIHDQRGNWTAWYAHTPKGQAYGSGPYKQYLDEARAAVVGAGIGDPDTGPKMAEREGMGGGVNINSGGTRTVNMYITAATEKDADAIAHKVLNIIDSKNKFEAMGSY